YLALSRFLSLNLWSILMSNLSSETVLTPLTKKLLFCASESSPTGWFGAGNNFNKFAAKGSIRLPGTWGSTAPLAGLPGLVYIARLLNGIRFCRVAPGPFGSFTSKTPVYGSQSCPEGSEHTPLLLK